VAVSFSRPTSSTFPGHHVSAAIGFSSMRNSGPLMHEYESPSAMSVGNRLGTGSHEILRHKLQGGFAE
jgi:hypothetical protein